MKNKAPELCQARSSGAFLNFSFKVFYALLRLT